RRECRPSSSCPAARASAAAAVRSAGDLPRLDQLDPDVVGRPDERDAWPVRHLDRPFQQAGAEAFEPPDVGLQVRRVEAEVLYPVVSAGVAGAEALAGAGARDVHRHAAVLALAADEPVAEHARLVAHDLEVEGLNVPFRRLPRIGRLHVDVVDAECHDGPPVWVGCYEPLTPSTRISRDRVVLIRSAFGARYSSQSSRPWACPTLGTSSTPSRLGSQPPSSVLVAPPRTTYRPPYFWIVGGTSFRYSSKPAASVASTSAMMYAGISSPSGWYRSGPLIYTETTTEVRQWDSSTDGRCSSPVRHAGSARHARGGSRPTAPGSCWPTSTPEWKRWPPSSVRSRFTPTSRDAKTSSRWSRSHTGAGAASTSCSTTRASSVFSRCWTWRKPSGTA